MAGLKYFKLDLHVHTPASNCYLNKSDTPDQIVQAAIDKGLSAIAITDHNTADWIDRMKEAAIDTGLVIFPGVEISMDQYHVVALFDPDISQKEVENLLGSLKIKAEEYGKTETICPKHYDDVFVNIHDHGGFAILAHIDGPKGAFFELAKPKADGKVSVPTACSKLFNEANYDAIECVHGHYPEGFDEIHSIRRHPAFYQSSDNPAPENPLKHSKEGIGSLFSWFHLDELNLEGLRQCFADPEVRIGMKDMLIAQEYPRIISMHVGGNGFLRYQKFNFHEGLNSIIGGKGVGKSLAVEFLRFGLQHPPKDDALFKDHTGKLAARLEEGNTIEIVYQQSDGCQYLIRRELLGAKKGGKLDTRDSCVNLETGDDYPGEISSMFPILAYSQTEVIKIAEDKNAQLELIDRFIENEKRLFEKKFDEIQAELEENDKRLSTSIQAKGKLDSLTTDIHTLSERIKSLNKYLDNPLFEAMKQVESKRAILDKRYLYTGDLIERIKEWRELVNTPDELSKEYRDDSEALAAQETAKKAYDYMVRVLDTLTVELIEFKKSISAQILAWMPEFDKVSKEYQELLEEIGGDRKTKERERKQLDNELQDLEKQSKEFQRLIGDLDGIMKSRSELLDQLERAHLNYYEVRKAKYDHLTALSDNKLKLFLEHAKETSDHENAVGDLLKGGGAFTITVGDRKKAAQNVSPRRLIQLVLDKNVPHLANETDLSELWAERVIEKFWQADDFSQVLALQHRFYPEDIPTIQFKKDGGQYGELDELSVGQKCTALLIIALCDGTMPVVIDQPEDALDIISVWEDIAKKLRRGKSSRQFILTTHNSSVAVAADSDQFIVLKAGANYGKVVAAGSIDRADVKKAVIAHLEGGDEPYKLRARKYNLHQ